MPNIRLISISIGSPDQQNREMAIQNRGARSVDREHLLGLRFQVKESGVSPTLKLKPRSNPG